MRVCVLGSSGFIGWNLLRGTNWTGVSRKDLDLMDQVAVETFFRMNTFDVVVHCAIVGGSRLRKDDGNIAYTNLLMFENVVSAFSGTLLYFSSGAALRGDPPTDPYGFSKWVIEKRCSTIERAHILRIWGCYGPGEPTTRFSAVCKREGHVVIEKDRYFDFVDIETVRKKVQAYVDGTCVDPCTNLVDEPRLLSEWADYFGATWEIRDQSGLDVPYIK